MLEVVLLHSDGSDCAVAHPADLIEATAEAMNMYACGHCPVLRIDGVVTNQWLGTQWAKPL